MRIPNLTLRNLLITGNEYGVGQGGRTVTLENVDASDNEEGALFLYSTKRVVGTNVTASGNGGPGIKADEAKVTITGLTAQNNLGGGVITSRKPVTLIDSTLSGNEFDIFNWHAPRLVNTTCELSQGPNPDGGTHTWGVCTND